MLGIDVARRALLLISTPPFRYFRRGEACAEDNNLYLVWSDDTIWKMPGQLCCNGEAMILFSCESCRAISAPNWPELPVIRIRMQALLTDILCGFGLPGKLY